MPQPEGSQRIQSPRVQRRVASDVAYPTAPRPTSAAFAPNATQRSSLLLEVAKNTGCYIDPSRPRATIGAWTTSWAASRSDLRASTLDRAQASSGLRLFDHRPPRLCRLHPRAGADAAASIGIPGLTRHELRSKRCSGCSATAPQRKRWTPTAIHLTKTRTVLPSTSTQQRPR